MQFVRERMVRLEQGGTVRSNAGRDAAPGPPTASAHRQWSGRSPAPIEGQSLSWPCDVGLFRGGAFTVLLKIIEIEDRVSNQLPWPVISNIPAAVNGIINGVFVF